MTDPLLCPAPAVKPRKSPEERLWGKVLKAGPEECWEWQGARGTNGHGRTMHYRDGQRIWTAAHRLAWELTFGMIPEGTFVCHKCDNPPCCNPDHLFLGSAADNTWDMVTKGRHGSVRLTPEQVAEIRSRYTRNYAPMLSRSGLPNGGGRMRSNTRELAAEFGVHESYLKSLIRGEYRREVSCEQPSAVAL
jgi:hypothetical protein